jgi:hypothetical protein
MSAEEKIAILKMVEEGKITAEEAERLLEALEADDADFQEDAFDTEASQNFTSESDENLDAIADKVRGFWQIPLWIGIIITFLSGLWIQSAMQSSGFGFWFYCAWIPFFLGVLIIALVAGGRKSHWLFVKIKQAPGESPQNITFGFPLPIQLAGWILRNFGHYIPGMENVVGVDEILETLAEMPTGDAVLIVDVKEDDGEEVQVFIG